MHCEFGNVSRIEGYTQRAQKRFSFDSKYKNDECYGKLKHPSDWRVGVLDDVAVFNLTFAICDKKHYICGEWKKTDEFKTRDCEMFSTGIYSYIPLSELTTVVLKDILTYAPRTVFGKNLILDYQKKIVPNILFELSKLLPDLYERLIEEYPQFSEIAPNFVGKRLI